MVNKISKKTKLLKKWLTFKSSHNHIIKNSGSYKTLEFSSIISMRQNTKLLR